MGFILKFASAIVVFCLISNAGSGAEFISGPVEARVLRIIDGDTFVAEAHVWPGHIVRVSVRIRGVDAPEMRSKCEAERIAAQSARLALEELIDEKPVLISNIGGGKYYGRVLADVTNFNGHAVGEALLNLSVVKAYDGGKRMSFCKFIQ